MPTVTPPSVTSGAVRRALALLEPGLRAHRPALASGLLALVLGTWALVAVPVPLKHSLDSALAVAGVPGAAGTGPADPGAALLGAAGGLVALVALQAGLRAASLACLHRAGAGAAAELRGRVLGHHLRTDVDQHGDGDAATVLARDVPRLRDLLAHDGPRMLAGILSLASLLGVLLVIEPVAAALVAATGALQALVAHLSLRAQGRRETAAATEEARCADAAAELLAAHDTLRTYDLAQRVEQDLHGAAAHAARTRARARRARTFERGLAETVTGLGVGAALLVGAWRMPVGGMTPGELTMVIAYVVLGAVLVRGIVRRERGLAEVGAAAQRVRRLLEHPVVVPEPRSPRSLDGVRGEVVFWQLGLPDADGAPGERISLGVPAGQQIALVDRDGREASALLACLQGRRAPRTGRVMLDRIDIRDAAPGDLHRRLAVVQREAALLPGTVRENLRLGRPGASDEEIVDAARRTGADEFITLLAEGYDTELGRAGATLSEGQRRRLAITRALLRDAAVVVLDGADEGLAPAERASVRRALAVLVAGRTTLLSSREQETVLAADRVVCFESGALVEDDGPTQLAEDPDSWLSSWLLTTGHLAH